MTFKKARVTFSAIRLLKIKSILLSYLFVLFYNWRTVALDCEQENVNSIHSQEHDITELYSSHNNIEKIIEIVSAGSRVCGAPK